MAGVFLALFFYPADGMLWGIAIGTATGMYNCFMLVVRIKRLPDLSLEKGKKHMKRGMVIRLSMVMAVLFLVTTRLPHVSLYGVGAGLLIPYCISTIVGVVDTVRQYRQSQMLMRKYYGE
ncbi:MAG: ATP synthase subunit I [Bacillota bacterium]